MCAALPNRRDPTDELEFAVRLMNETTAGITGIKTGVHICRGNWSRREDVLLTGNYGPMLPYLTQMNIDQLVLECATPRAGEMEVFKEYSNEKEIGFGVVNPRTDDIESPEQIVARVKELLQYFDPDKIYLNPRLRFRNVCRTQREYPRNGFPENESNRGSRRIAAGRISVGPETRSPG